MASGTFFASDTGLRFWQIKELVANNWQTLAIQYAFEPLDPTRQHLPFYYAYGVVDGSIFLSISPFLPLLTSFLYAQWGMVALPVLPVLGGVLTAVGTYQLAKFGRVARPRLVLWGTILATPMLFYSLTLWDHTLAAACAVWSVLGVAVAWRDQRWLPAVLGGIAAGLGLGQRPEMYLFVAVLGLGVLVLGWRMWRLTLAFAAGGAMAALPIWWLQYLWYGHPFGLTAARSLFGYGRVSNYAVVPFDGVPLTRSTIISKFLGHINPRDIPTFAALLAVFIAIYLIGLGLRQRRRQVTWAGLVVALVGYGMYLYFGLFGPITGLLSTFPLIAVGLMRVPEMGSREQAANRFVFGTAVMFVLGMALVWPTFGGLQWGARYLLPAYPLLLYLAALHLTHFIQEQGSDKWRQTVVATAVTLSILSILLQLDGVGFLNREHRLQREAKTVVESLSPELILTNSPFLPATMAATDKTFLFVKDSAGMSALLDALWQQDVTTFGVVALTAVPLPVPTEGAGFRVQSLTPAVYQLVAQP